MQSIISFFLSILTLFSLMTGFGEESAYRQPIDNTNGGDPFIVESNGNAYYTFTTGSGVDIRKIKAFDNTETLEARTVFRAGENGTVKDIWAPEIHRIGNRWYIISSALFDKNAVQRGTMPYRSDAADITEHDDFYRYTFILESKTDDIFGEYEFKSVLAPSGMNNIDGTYLKKDGKLYFVTSSYLDIAHQCITVTEMINPYTLKTDKNGNTVTSVLSEPELYWETKGWKVNEGPSVLYHNDNTFIVYSASGFSSGGYCLGMLTLKGDDVLNPCCWKKSLTRVLYHRPLDSIYNAGHCSFLYRDDGKIYMIYHATQKKEFSESPRLTYIREIKFIKDIPFFG